MKVTRRASLIGLLSLPLGVMKGQASASRSLSLLRAARQQIGVTTQYDAAYVRLDYPGGDVPRDRGVCIDVIIRAYRDAFGFDFQEHIHRDMAANFGAYPQRWGLTRTDRNIDHRRVPNLETWLVRHGHDVSDMAWQPGDLVTCRVSGSLPHVGIVSDRKDRRGRYRAIHNIGLGTLEDSRIWAHGHQRRFRFLPLAS
ncbi:MAG: DUF1287 domain-containing protein [Pseudomonadota bacterium]